MGDPSVMVILNEPKSNACTKNIIKRYFIFSPQFRDIKVIYKIYFIKIINPINFIKFIKFSLFKIFISF